MFSNTFLLGLLISQPAFMIAAALPATTDNTQQPPGGDVQTQSGSSQTSLYTITSARIHRYSGPPSATRKLEARQQASPSPMSPPVLTSTALGSAGPSPTPDPYTDGRPVEPFPTTMEDFTLTVMSGASNAPSVHCNLTWDAGTANSGTRDHVASENFSCDDKQTSVRMERRNVTPLYGFYVFVQMPNTPVATWMVKDLNSDANKAAGWVVVANGGDATFNGMAALTQAANQTLADFLGVPLPQM